MAGLAAILKLHELGFAHLDIILENICFHGDSVVLIDHDHSRMSDE